MKPKTTKIIFWVVTVLFCLANFASGIAELFPNEQGLDIMKQLGYPAYLLFIIGIAKILGSIAVIQTKFKTIKEWAYAGFTIDYIGASLSFYFIKSRAFDILLPLVFLVVMLISYFLWKKVERIKNDKKTRSSG